MSDLEYETVLNHFYNMEMIDMDLGTKIHESLNSWIDYGNQGILEIDLLLFLIQQLKTEVETVKDHYEMLNQAKEAAV